MSPRRGCIHKKCSPGWCGSVDQALACEPKGHWFDSQLGHMPRLWARSPVRHMQDVSLSHPCFFPSLSPSLPLSLKISKILKKNKINGVHYLKWCKGMFWSQEAPVKSSQVLIWENVVTYKVHLSFIDCINALVQPPSMKRLWEIKWSIVYIGRYF